MNQTDVSPTAPSERAPTHAGAPPGRRSRWTASRIAALVIGALLVFVALLLLGVGGTGMWAYLTKRDGGYATTDVHTFSTAGSALATTPTELGSAGTGWLYPPALLGEVRIRVTPVSAQAPLFVGIARSDDVDRYLAGVDRTVINDFWDDDVQPFSGGSARSAPATRRFWVASSSGTGTRSLVWKPEDGTWTVVVMNADARPGLDIGADLGARVPALPWIALGLLLGGAVFMAGGILLIVGAIRRRTGWGPGTGSSSQV
jgi:hypothetical protein